MKDLQKIRENENKYKQMLFERLKGDRRLAVSCPDFKYPEPVYFHIKSIRTEKTIAISIDGEEEILRFWDYVDDGYEGEDGVWTKMQGNGFDTFINKLYTVMDCAVDIEFFASNGITDDYFAGVVKGGLDESKAKALLKKHGAGVKFLYAKISNFYGDRQYVYDRSLNAVRR